jgi:hypothetical protein
MPRIERDVTVVTMSLFYLVVASHRNGFQFHVLLEQVITRVSQMPTMRMVRRPPNYCPRCGGAFRLKAKVSRVSQKSETRYLQCFDCKQIIVCNYKTQRPGLAEQVA